MDGKEQDRVMVVGWGGMGWGRDGGGGSEALWKYGQSPLS